MIDILGEKYYHYILTGLGQVGFLNDFELLRDDIHIRKNYLKQALPVAYSLGVTERHQDP